MAAAECRPAKVYLSLFLTTQRVSPKVSSAIRIEPQCSV